MKVDTQATSITPFAFGVGSIFVNLLNEHYWKLCFWVLPVFRKIATCLKEHTLCWWNGGKIVCVGIIVWKGVKTSKDGKFRQTKCIVRGQFKISHQIMASNMFQGRLKNVTLHLIYREDKSRSFISFATVDIWTRLQGYVVDSGLCQPERNSALLSQSGWSHEQWPSWKWINWHIQLWFLWINWEKLTQPRSLLLWQ